MKAKQVLKIISLVVCITFTTTTVCSSAPSVYQISVPEKHGKVTQRYKGTDEKVIVHIQDAHSSSEAQENLAEIICDLIPQIKKADYTDESDQSVKSIDQNFLDESSGQNLRNQTAWMPFIGIEGAIGEYDLKELRDFPLEEPKRIVGKDYVKEGKFIGAEYASMIADQDFTLYGLEDQELFVKDFKAFYTVAGKQAELEREIEILEGQLSLLKDILYNADLKNFDEKASSYETNHMNMVDFLAVLYEKLDELEMDAFDYMHLLQFREVFVMEGTINYELLDEEIKELSEKLLEVVAEENGKPIHEYLKKYHESSITQKDIVFYLHGVAVKQNISTERFHMMQRAIRYWYKYTMVDMARLLPEVLDVNNEIRKKLAHTTDETVLIDLWYKVTHLKHLLALKALKEDVERFRKNKNDYALSRIYEKVKQLAANHAIAVPDVSPTINVDQILDLVDEFYLLADERNSAMLNNLVEKMDEQGQQTGVLVAGGYHSAGLTELMKERGLSYLTVTPQINNIVEDVAYMDRMMGNIAPLDPLLTSPLQVSRFNAGVRLASGVEAFEKIVQEAGYRIHSQVLIDKKGNPLPPADVNQLIQWLNETKNDQCIDLAKAIDYVVNNEKLHQEIYTAFSRGEKLNLSVLLEEIGKTVHDQTVLERFIDEMQNELERMFGQTQISAKEEGLAVPAGSQELPPVEETGIIGLALDDSVIIAGISERKSDEKGRTVDSLEVFLKILSSIEQELGLSSGSIIVYGGVVRDYLFNKKIKLKGDVDILIRKDVAIRKKEIFQRMRDSLGITLDNENKFITDGRINDELVLDYLGLYDYDEQNNTMNFVSVDPTMDQFLGKCQLSINTIGICSDGKVIDTFNAVEDIKKQVLKFVGGDINQYVNHLSILRAIRFKHEFNFKFNNETEVIVKKFFHTIDTAVDESFSGRWRAYWNKWFKQIELYNASKIEYKAERYSNALKLAKQCVSIFSPINVEKTFEQFGDESNAEELLSNFYRMFFPQGTHLSKLRLDGSKEVDKVYDWFGFGMSVQQILSHAQNPKDAIRDLREIGFERFLIASGIDNVNSFYEKVLDLRSAPSDAAHLSTAEEGRAVPAGSQELPETDVTDKDVQAKKMKDVYDQAQPRLEKLKKFLISVIEQNTNFSWRFNDSKILAEVYYDDIFDVFTVEPDAAFKKAHPELDVLDLEVDDAFIPMPGSFGQLKVDITIIDGEIALFFKEIQPSRGFRQIKPSEERKPYMEWSREAMEHIMVFARVLGINHFYGSTGEFIKAEYLKRLKTRLSDGTLKDWYRDPFQDNWQTQEVMFVDNVREGNKDVRVVTEAPLWRHMIEEKATVEEPEDLVSEKDLSDIEEKLQEYMPIPDLLKEIFADENIQPHWEKISAFLSRIFKTIYDNPDMYQQAEPIITEIDKQLSKEEILDEVNVNILKEFNGRFINDIARGLTTYENVQDFLKITQLQQIPESTSGIPHSYWPRQLIIEAIMAPLNWVASPEDFSFDTARFREFYLLLKAIEHVDTEIKEESEQRTVATDTTAEFMFGPFEIDGQKYLMEILDPKRIDTVIENWGEKEGRIFPPQKWFDAREMSQFKKPDGTQYPDGGLITIKNDVGEIIAMAYSAFCERGIGGEKRAFTWGIELMEVDEAYQKNGLGKILISRVIGQSRKNRRYLSNTYQGAVIVHPMEDERTETYYRGLGFETIWTKAYRDAQGKEAKAQELYLILYYDHPERGAAGKRLRDDVLAKKMFLNQRPEGRGEAPGWFAERKPPALGRITPGTTWPGRNKELDAFIKEYLEKKNLAYEPLVVEMGTGYPAVTTLELAKTLEDSAQVISVDINIPAYVVEFSISHTKREIGIVFFDENDNIIYTASRLRDDERHIYHHLVGNKEVQEKALVVRDDLMKHGKGSDYETEEQKITFHPFQALEAEQSNLHFIKGGFELPIEGEADIVRSTNVFFYYNADETRTALQKIGLKLKEGGIFIVGDERTFLIYEKRKNRNGTFSMVPREFLIRTGLSDISDATGNAVLGLLRDTRHIQLSELNSQFPQHADFFNNIENIFYRSLNEYTKWNDLKQAVRQAKTTIDGLIATKMMQQLNDEGFGVSYDAHGLIHISLKADLKTVIRLDADTVKEKKDTASTKPGDQIKLFSLGLPIIASYFHPLLGAIAAGITILYLFGWFRSFKGKKDTVLSSEKGSIRLRTIVLILCIIGFGLWAGRSMMQIRESTKRHDTVMTQKAAKGIHDTVTFDTKEAMYRYTSNVLLENTELGGYSYQDENSKWVVVTVDIGDSHSVSTHIPAYINVHGAIHSHTGQGITADPIYAPCPSWTDIISFIKDNRLKEDVIVIGEGEEAIIEKRAVVDGKHLPFINALKAIDEKTLSEETIRRIVNRQLMRYVPDWEAFDLGEGDVRKELHTNSWPTILQHIFGFTAQRAYVREGERMERVPADSVDMDELNTFLQERGKTIEKDIEEEIRKAPKKNLFSQMLPSQGKAFLVTLFCAFVGLLDPSSLLAATQDIRFAMVSSFPLAFLVAGITASIIGIITRSAIKDFLKQLFSQFIAPKRALIEQTLDALASVPAREYIGEEMYEILKEAAGKGNNVKPVDYEGDEKGLEEKIDRLVNIGAIGHDDIVLVKFIEPKDDGKRMNIFAHRVGETVDDALFLRTITFHYDGSISSDWLDFNQSIRGRNLLDKFLMSSADVLSRTMPHAAIYAHYRDIRTAKKFTEIFNARFDLDMKSQNMNNVFYKLGRLLELVDDEETKENKEWEEIVLQRINRIKDPNTTDVQYCLEKLDEISQKTLKVYRHLFLNGYYSFKQFKDNEQTFINVYGAAWYRTTTEKRFNEIMQIVEKYTPKVIVDRLAAYDEKQDEGAKQALERLFFTDITTAMYVVGTISAQVPEREERMAEIVPLSHETPHEIKARRIAQYMNGKTIYQDNEATKAAYTLESQMMDPSKTEKELYSVEVLIKNSHGQYIGTFYVTLQNDGAYSTSTTLHQDKDKKLGSQLFALFGNMIEGKAHLRDYVINEETCEKLFEIFYAMYEEQGILWGAKTNITFSDTIIDQVLSETLVGKLLQKAGFENFKLVFQEDGKRYEGDQALKIYMDRAMQEYVKDRAVAIGNVTGVFPAFFIEATKAGRDVTVLSLQDYQKEEGVSFLGKAVSDKTGTVIFAIIGAITTFAVGFLVKPVLVCAVIGVATIIASKVLFDIIANKPGRRDFLRVGILGSIGLMLPAGNVFAEMADVHTISNVLIYGDLKQKIETLHTILINKLKFRYGPFFYWFTTKEQRKEDFPELKAVWSRLESWEIDFLLTNIDDTFNVGDKIRSKYDEELKDISAKVTQTSIDTKKKKQTEIASEIVMGVILAVLRKRNLVQYADYLQENVFNDLQDLYKVKRTNAEQFAQIRQDDTMKEKVAALEYFISEVKTLIAQMKNEVLKQAQLDQKRQARVSLSKDEGSTVVVLTAILTTVIGISLFFKPLLYLGAGFGIVAFLTGVISRLIPGAAPEIDKREGRLLQMPISRRAALQTLSSIIGFVTLGGITGIVTGCSSFRKGADTSLLSRVTDVVYDETIPTVDDLMKQPRVYDPGLYTIGQFKKGRPTVITVMGATPTHRHYINYKTMLKSFENNYNTVVFLYDFTKPIKENGYYLRTSFKKFIDINQPEHITFVPHSYGTNVLMQAVLDLEAGEENIFRNTDIIQLTPVFMGSRKATNASRGYKRAFLELIAKLGFPDYTLSTEAADPEREIVADLCNNYDLFDKRVGTINVIAVKNDSHAPNKTSSPQFKQRYKEFVEDKLDKDGFLESKGGDGHLEVLWIPKALSMIMKLVDPQRKKPAPIEKEKARKTVTLLETDEVAHAEGMMLESPAAISKNGINAIEEIKKQVQSHSQQIRINGKVVHVDNDLLAHYKQLTFKTEEEFLDFLKKFLISEFSTYPPENNEITLAVLDEAESLFEDHQPNGFIGIHRSLFEKLHTSPKTALALLMVGLRHELSHEAMYMERVVLVDHFQKVQNMTFSKATQAAETFITDNRGTLKQALKNNGLWDTVEEKMLERDLDHAEGVALDIEQVIASDILPASAPFVKRYQEEGRFAYRTILEDELETLDVKYGLIDKENHIFKDIQTIFSKIITAAGVSEENITLHLVNSDEINAWWLTDSRSFFLSVGLIKTLHQYLKENNKIMTQDMVAFILGHELRHMVQYLEGKDVIVEEESKNKKQMRKNKEYDADLYGMRYAAAAGYNPGASVDVLAFLGEITGATYISGHPDARDRVGEVKKILTSPDEFIPNVKKGAHYFSDTFINEPLINVPTVVEEFHETMLAAESLDEVGESIQEVDSLDRMEEALMYYYFRFLYDLSSGVIKDPNFQKYMSYILTADNIMTVIEERFDMAGAHSYYFDWKIPITLSKLFHYYTLQGPGQEHGSLSLLGKEAGVSRDKVIQSIYTKISERLKSLRYVSDDEREKKRQRYEIMKASVDGILHESDHKELMRVIAHTEALGIEYRKQVTLPSRNLLETFSFPILSTRNLRDGSVIVEYFDTQALVNNFESWWSYFEHYDRERYEQRSRTKKVYQDSQIFGVKEWQQKKYGKVELPALLFDILPDYGFDEELKEEIENGRSQFLPLYLRFLAFHFMVQKQGPFAAATVQNHPPLIHKRMIEEKTQSLLTKQYPSLNNPVITLLSKLKYFSLLRSFDAAYDTDIQQIIAELSPDDINTVFQILTNEPSYYLSSIPAPLAKMIDFESYLKQVQKQFIPYYCSIVADIFRMQSRNIIINQNHLTMIMTLLRTFNVRYPGSLTNNPGVQKLLGTVIEVLAKERDEKILNMILMTVADTKDDDIKETLLSYLFTSYFPQQDVEEKIDCLLRMYPFSSNVQNKRLESLFDTIDYAGMSDSSKEQFLERFLPLFKTDKSMLSHTPVSRGEKGLHQKLSRDYMQVLKDKGISFVELVQKMDAANAVVTRFDFIVDNKAMWEGSSYEELHQIVAVITNSSAGYATYQNLIGTLFLTKIKADIPTFVKPSTRGNYNIYKETMGDDVFPRYLSAYIRKGKDIKNWLFEGMSFDESMSLVLYALPRSSERDSRLRDIIASFNPSNEEMLRFSDSFVALENTRELLSLNVQHGSGFSTGGPALRDEAILHLIGLNKIGGDNVPTPSDIQHRITILNTVVPEKVKENIDIEAELSSLEASLTETAKKLEKVLETNPLSVDRYGCATSFNDALIRFVTRFVVPESEHFDYFNLRDFRYQQNEYFLKFLPLYQNEADFFQKVDVSFADKVAKLLRYFPAKTTFRDNEIEKLLVQYEARIFGISNPLVYQKSNLRGAAYESYDVIRRQRLDIKKITREDADFLINHYKDALLLMTDGTHQIMLGRKIYALEMHFHPDIFSDFKRGFSEILILFPKFSDTRDSVLNEFINMAAVRSAAHLREIDNYILAQQRLTREADVVKDTYTDELWKAISQLSTRREKADFILWVLDMNRPVAESIRGPSSYNNVNFTSLPAIIFGLTQGEREKLFYELLSRRNGLFEIDDTSEPEEYAQFERFIDELFSIVFPDDELGEGQAVMHDIFKTIFKQYSTERRIMLFNALFDLFSDPDVGRRQRGVKVRLFLEQLGVVGVKVGQYLSEQATLFDGAEDIREELKKLKTDATGFHKRAIFQFLYESGLLEGIQIGDDFIKVDYLLDRLGVASIKQVYEVLLSDGRKVTGKFMRPAAEKFLDEDLSVLKKVLTMLEVDYERRYAVPSSMLDDITTIVFDELKFEQEAKNAERHRKNIQRRMPRVAEPFTINTPKVVFQSQYIIIEQNVNGITLADLFLLKKKEKEGIDVLTEEDRKRVTEIEKRFPDDLETFLAMSIVDIKKAVMSEFFEQVYKEGFFHGDLHFGNVMVTPTKELYIIDWGAAGEVQNEDKRSLLLLLVSLEGKQFTLFRWMINRFLDSKIQTDKEANRQLKQIVKSQETLDNKLKNITRLIGEKNLNTRNNFIMYLKALSAVAPIFDTETDPDLTNDEKRTLDKELQRMTRKALFSRQTKKVPESPTATLQGSGKLFSVNLGLASLFGAEGIIDQANLLISQSMLEGPEVFTPIVLGIIVFIIAARWIIRNLDQLSTSFAKMFLFITELFRGQDEQLQEIDSSQTDVDATRKSISIYATLPETYELFGLSGEEEDRGQMTDDREKIDEMRRSVAVNYAPWIEEWGVLGIVALLIWKRLLRLFRKENDAIERLKWSNIGWKEKVKITAVSRIPVTVFTILHVLFSHSGYNIFTALGVILVGGLSAHYFGQFHERDKKSYIQAALIFTMPFFTTTIIAPFITLPLGVVILSFPVMLVVSTLVHRWWNYTVPKWSQDNTKRQFEALTAIPANQYIGMKLKEVLEKEYIETGTIVFFNYEGNNTGLVEMLRSKEQKGEIHDSDVIVIKFVKTNIDGKNISVFGDTLANIKKELTDERIGTKDMWQKFIFNILSRIDNEGKLHWEALYVQESLRDKKLGSDLSAQFLSVLSKTVPGIAIYGNAINIITAECFADRFNGRFDTYRDDLTPNDRYLRLARMMGFITEDEMRTEKGWVRFLVERINTVKNQRGFNTLTDLQYYLREFDTLAQRSAILFRISNSLIGDSGTPKDEFKGIVDVLTERYGTQWYYAPSKEQFDEITTLLKQYNIFKDVDSMTAYKPEDEYSKNVIKKILFNDKNVGVLAVGTVPTYAELKTTQEEKMKQRKIAESKAINPIEQKDMEKDLTFSEDKPYHFEVDPELVSNSMSQLEGLGLSELDVGGALSTIKSDLPLAYGFHSEFYEGLTTQMPLIKQDFVRYVREKENTGDRSVTMYDIGLGRSPQEAMQIIKAFNEAIEEVIDEEKRKLWTLEFIGIDATEEYLIMADDIFKAMNEGRHTETFFDPYYDAGVQYFEKPLSIKLNMQLIQAHTLDASRLAMLGNAAKGDYVFCRHVTYANHRTASGRLNRQSMAGYLSDILNIFLSTKNIIQLLCKESTRFIIEPIDKARVMRADNERDVPVFHIPGVELFTYNTFLPDQRIAEESLDNRGTGIYRITDPHKIGEYTLEGFLEELDRQNKIRDDIETARERPFEPIDFKVISQAINVKKARQDITGAQKQLGQVERVVLIVPEERFAPDEFISMDEAAQRFPEIHNFASGKMIEVLTVQQLNKDKDTIADEIRKKRTILFFIGEEGKEQDVNSVEKELIDSIKTKVWLPTDRDKRTIIIGGCFDCVINALLAAEELGQDVVSLEGVGAVFSNVQKFIDTHKGILAGIKQAMKMRMVKVAA